jgi:plastocyanin
MDSPDTRDRWTWSKLVWVAPAVFAALFLLIMVVLAGGFEPFLFGLSVIILIAAFVGRRFPRRAGPITVLVVMTLLVLVNLPAIAEDLVHPESFVNFALFAITPLTLAVVAVVAAVAALRSAPDRSASRAAYGAIAVIVVGGGVSLVATLGVEDDTMAAGDLLLIAEEAEFSPVTLTGPVGVAVFVDNEDPVRHTFAVPDLELEVELPANTKRRIEIAAPAGAYQFVCTVTGHDSMKGTLRIEG